MVTVVHLQNGAEIFRASGRTSAGNKSIFSVAAMKMRLFFIRKTSAPLRTLLHVRVIYGQDSNSLCTWSTSSGTWLHHSTLNYFCHRPALVWSWKMLWIFHRGVAKRSIMVINYEDYVSASLIAAPFCWRRTFCACSTDGCGK